MCEHGESPDGRQGTVETDTRGLSLVASNKCMTGIHPVRRTNLSTDSESELIYCGCCLAIIIGLLLCKFVVSIETLENQKSVCTITADDA